MARWIRCGTLVIAFAGIAACATGYSPTPYWMIRETAFTFIKPGVTTRQEVRQRIGIPLLESRFTALDEEVWDYRYLEGTTIRMLAYIHFDSRGVVKYYWQRIDPAYQSGMHP